MNTLRGLILGLFLLASFVLGYAALVSTTAESADGQRAVLPLSAGCVACAIIASGALSGMTDRSGSSSQASQGAQVTFGGRGAVGPGPQPPYGQQPYGGAYGQPQQQGQSEPGQT